MTKSLDWKFIVTAILAIVAAAIPALIWQLDKQPKSLRAEIITLASLIPENRETLEGLKISIEDIPVTNPYITIIEFTNNGGIPINKSDYEEPIEAKVQDRISILRATITETFPHDLNPTISFKRNSAIINPLLLNPKDKIQVAIISSGGKPDFKFSSRISGVSKIRFEDGSVSSELKGYIYYEAAVGFLLLLVYMGATSHVLAPMLARKKMNGRYSMGDIRLMPLFVAIVSLLGSLELTEAVIVYTNNNYINFFTLTMAATVIALQYIAKIVRNENINRQDS